MGQTRCTDTGRKGQGKAVIVISSPFAIRNRNSSYPGRFYSNPSASDYSIEYTPVIRLPARKIVFNEDFIFNGEFQPISGPSSSFKMILDGAEILPTFTNTSQFKAQFAVHKTHLRVWMDPGSQYRSRLYIAASFLCHSHTRLQRVAYTFPTAESFPRHHHHADNYWPSVHISDTEAMRLGLTLPSRPNLS